MGKAVAVYVRDADMALWRRLERYAAERRTPVSGVVILAVQEYLDRREGNPDQPPTGR